MKYYEDKREIAAQPEFGCGFCWDAKRRENKELYFLDRANNMRICLFCPYCGRNYEEVVKDV